MLNPIPTGELEQAHADAEWRAFHEANREHIRRLRVLDAAGRFGPQDIPFILDDDGRGGA